MDEMIDLLPPNLYFANIGEIFIGVDSWGGEQAHDRLLNSSVVLIGFCSSRRVKPYLLPGFIRGIQHLCGVMWRSRSECKTTCQRRMKQRLHHSNRSVLKSNFPWYFPRVVTIWFVMCSSRKFRSLHLNSGPLSFSFSPSVVTHYGNVRHKFRF